MPGSILFIHENHPAQFGGIARHLASRGWDVVFCTANARFPPDQIFHITPGGYRVMRYGRKRSAAKKIHPYLATTEAAILNGQGLARTAIKLRAGGFHPDVIVAHSGWGSGSFAKSVWPNAKLVQYLEWWYRYPPTDRLPGDGMKLKEDESSATLCRNIPFLLDTQSADLILVPTQFQRAQVPGWVNVPIEIIHDGVDTEAFRPHRKGDRRYTHPGLPDDAPIVTYATRGMEPMRGFPEFMRDLPAILRDNPTVHAVIAGDEHSHYGPPPAKGDTWKAKALREYEIDLSRVHFVGPLATSRYRALLRRSRAHVYLTRPFVASWSLLDAMSTACPLVVSDTEPVQEFVSKDNAQLTDFQNSGQIAAAVTWCLFNPAEARRMGDAARARVEKDYAREAVFKRKELLLYDLIS